VSSVTLDAGFLGHSRASFGAMQTTNTFPRALGLFARDRPPWAFLKPSTVSSSHSFLSFSARYHLWDFKERVVLEVRLFDGRPPEYVTPYPAPRTVPAKPQHAKSYFTLRFASTCSGS